MFHSHLFNGNITRSSRSSNNSFCWCWCGFCCGRSWCWCYTILLTTLVSICNICYIQHNPPLSNIPICITFRIKTSYIILGNIFNCSNNSKRTSSRNSTSLTTNSNSILCLYCLNLLCIYILCLDCFSSVTFTASIIVFRFACWVWIAAV